MKKILIVALLCISASVMAQTEKIDTATVSKIKKEGFDKSQIMDIMSMLTDVYGPRLTNSPNYKNSADYAKRSLEKWGCRRSSRCPTRCARAACRRTRWR